MPEELALKHSLGCRSPTCARMDELVRTIPKSCRGRLQASFSAWSGRDAVWSRWPDKQDFLIEMSPRVLGAEDNGENRHTRIRIDALAKGSLGGFSMMIDVGLMLC